MLNASAKPADRTDPAHIAISKSRGMTIDWSDGHKSVYSVALLRDNCPCASCTGAEGGEPQRTNYQAEQKDTNPFQMYKPALKMLSVTEVGAYAVRIDWNDGHNTGIYSFRHLRQICPCEACKTKQ
ncbi:MAG TPA: DUF971 domain-containing protein [Bryobacteraceae bacterium]|jgi:DUF971 family protein